MHLYIPIQNLFNQLQFAIESLSNKEYVTPIPTLFNASIGQHIRHIIELFIELENGYINGLVNYDNRKRDYTIETDRYVALEKLESILQQIKKANKDLFLVSEFSVENSHKEITATNYYRELVYNIEHTVHHMALIKVGINIMNQTQLPVEFGVATSTLKHKQQCAQ